MSHLVRIRPKLLLADTEKTLLPKLEFLEAKGFSCLEIAKMLSIRPNVLGSSLDKQIKPAYDFLRNLLQSDKKVIAAAKRCPDILAHKKLPCLDILRGYGVSDANIATLVIYRPSFLMLSSDQSRKILERVVEIGFDASKISFVLALNAFWSMSKSTWESKFDAYKKWGWSEEEVWEAFQRNPWCMMISEDKLMGSMDFFINQMGWRPCLMAKCPTILGLSLKKRVVPRCSVFQLLLSKGLVEKEVSINTLLLASEEKFLQKFVARYEKKAPELLKMYKETLDLSNRPQINDET
ncbi:uncharacterized protein LOC112093229 [Morus notabilis]|uniref:uncharacterized protein LOC112093229 n=1 Tax=Morus notabilis TaxID=981085 RepID=UPI000CED16A1|nr:uncharacterized protein LOC112093229 [Morus notabilis]